MGYHFKTEYKKHNHVQHYSCFNELQCKATSDNPTTINFCCLLRMGLTSLVKLCFLHIYLLFCYYYHYSLQQLLVLLLSINLLFAIDQKLWPCPLFRSKLSAIFNLCKFMQIRTLSQDPIRYTSPHAKFERCIANGSKVMAMSVIWVKQRPPSWIYANQTIFPQCGSLYQATYQI